MHSRPSRTKITGEAFVRCLEAGVQLPKLQCTMLSQSPITEVCGRFELRERERESHSLVHFVFSLSSLLSHRHFHLISPQRGCEALIAMAPILAYLELSAARSLPRDVRLRLSARYPNDGRWKVDLTYGVLEVLW